MAHGSNSYASDGITVDAQSTGSITNMSGTLSASTPGFGGDLDSLHGDGVYPNGYAIGSSHLSNNATPNSFGMAHGSNSNATNGTALAAQSAGTSPTVSRSFSPSALKSVTGPNGGPRWPCTTCTKTFSRQADMVRHAKKHSGERQYLCPVAGCKYKGSYRQDKLDQHRRNCGH